MRSKNCQIFWTRPSHNLALNSSRCYLDPAVTMGNCNKTHFSKEATKPAQSEIAINSGDMSLLEKRFEFLKDYLLWKERNQ